MRLHVDDKDGTDPVKRELVGNCDVYVDGIKTERV